MSDSGSWDAQLRPHLTPYFAYGAAFVIAAAHITVGFLLKAMKGSIEQAIHHEMDELLAGKDKAPAKPAPKAKKASPRPKKGG